MRAPDFWTTINPRSLLALPLAALYGIGNWLDRKLTTPRAARLPVISIGNVTIGGAGKTPTCIALAELLAQAGENPHILTRGYGGAQILPRRVMPTDRWEQVGDEPLLLARHAPTWVARDRLAASSDAWEHGASVALCDDAHQHYRLKKTASLVVIDGGYGLGNRLLFPAGPLREPLASAFDRTDAIIFIGDDVTGLLPQLPKHIPMFRATLAPLGNTAFLAQHHWLAFAGLGRPQKFFDQLRALGALLPATASFDDHHPYTRADIEELIRQAESTGLSLITTEKDFVKIPPDLQSRVTVLPVALKFADETGLLAFLRERIVAARGT